ncbi:MAG: hypothetical protein PUK59_04170 [Actinomycetaceae bacterium]|nr:hypothetical protein [Actinomycetaceae bacterium]MDY5854515.1 hypothetical protein [Arcanobacterium sp.]
MLAYFLYILVGSLVINLSITLVCELIVAFIWGMTKIRSIIVVILVNLITNPLLNLIMVTLSFSSMGRDSLWLLLLFEPAVFLLEGYLYQRTIADIPHPFLFSFAANMASASVGMLI